MNKQININIKYLDKDMPKLIQADFGNWIDLYTAEDVSMNPGDHKLIRLGVIIQLPEGYEAYLLPRSSTFKKYGIIVTNSMGIIDHSYCGDNDQWFMPVIAMRDTHISFNDRICQFRILENQPTIVFDERDHLEGADRGGFGSTGKN